VCAECRFDANILFLCGRNQNFRAMGTRISKQVILLIGLLAAGLFAQAQESGVAKQGLMSNKTKKLVVDAKIGRSFLGDTKINEIGRADVFFGGANLAYGVLLSNNFLGIGGGVEYVDMLDNGSFDFPIYVDVRHYFSKEANKSFFIGVKAGYVLGGKKSYLGSTSVEGDEFACSIDRSMGGLYGELALGYCFKGFSVFASYNYRSIHYDVTLIPVGVGYVAPWSSFTRTMHTVMGGVSFMLF
jgi:hypothetical protein